MRVMNSMKIDASRLAAMILLFLALFALAACQPGSEEDSVPEDALVLVDGVAITPGMVDRFLAMRNQRQAGAFGRQQALDELVRLQAVSNRALTEGMQKDPQVAAELALTRQQILFNRYAADYMALNPVSESELRASYNATVKRSGMQQVRLQSIHYENEQEALAALLAAEEGQAFADLLARAKAAGARIESLEWVDLSQFPEDYGPVVVDTKANTLVPVPLRDEDGWRIFYLRERRHYQPPSFDQVKQGLRQQLQRERLQSWIDRIKNQADIEYLTGDAAS